MSSRGPQTVNPAGHSPAVSHPIGSPRNFVLAWIGLLSLLADEIPALLERSVERGNAVMERAQTEAKRRRVARPEVAPPGGNELQNELSRRGLPTHDDLAILLQKVSELEQQIDQIASQRATSE